MRRTPRNKTGRSLARSTNDGVGGVATHSTRTIAVTNSSSSNYHSLQSVVSSDSRDSDDLSNEMRLLENEERHDYSSSSGSSESAETHPSNANPIARLRAAQSSSSGSHHRRAVAAAAMAPPPPPPPPASMPPMNKNHSSAAASSNDIHSKHLQMASSSGSSSQQNKALLSLLQEMRTLEQHLQQQSLEHATEKKALMDSMAQQGKYITQLEESQKSLQKQNDSLKKQLKGVLTKLDRFATGCWKFSSASVKKMSEALHIQVHEWGKLYQIDTSNGLASPSEEEAMERTTMEKIQSMHLEIKELKDENHELKEKIKKAERRRKKRGMNSASVDGGSVISGIDNSDEVSHMSGITQMTATTSMTATTAKLMDAMTGFLNEHDASQHSNSAKDDPREGRAPAVASSSQDASPKSKPHKKVVQISSPRSILKPTSKYDQRLNEQRAAERPQKQQQHSPNLQKKRLEKAPHQLHHQQERQRLDSHHHRHRANQQRPHQQARHKPPPGLPKSPMTRQGRSNKGTGNIIRSQNGASMQPKGEEWGFANFDDFGNNEFAVTNENETWFSSWGDEQSEV